MKNKKLTQELIEKIKRSTEIESNIARKIIIWLIEKSQDLTKPVAVSIYTTQQEDMDAIEKIARDTANSISTIMYRNHSLTHLYSFFQENKLDMCLSWATGIYVKNNGMKTFVKKSYEIRKLNGEKIFRNNEIFTIWVARKEEKYLAEVIDFNIQEINDITL
jgi:hypothetical protein